jgi:apolipoprotein N-acyltransferase
VRVVQAALPDAAYAAAAALPPARTALLQGFVEGALAAPMPGGAGVTVAPEGALPGPVPARGPSGLEPLLAGLGPSLLGGPARVEGGVANAAFAWRAGRLERVYSKRRLAPIGETNLVPGHAPGLAVIGGVRVAPLICFEAAFPELARRAAREGAQLLAVLTNDAFGRYLGTPLQHLRMARFRAVETARPLAFASNAGPSAVIDGAGRVLARTAIGRPDAAVAMVRLDARQTPFLRWGDWPGTLALVGSGLLALVAGAKGGPPRS